MKKLLGILGTITIAGSGVVGLVGNVPSPTKNNISYQQTNNLENLNRNKRENEEFFLTDPIDGNDVVRRNNQLEAYWCGPASVEWILSHFQLNIDSILNNANNDRLHRYINFQHYLSDLMHIQPLGSSPINLVNVLNDFIINNNLNSRRQYQLTELQPVYNNYSQFYNIISNSLRNNMPVVFAFTGVMPGELYNHNHFVTITGFSGDNSDLLTMDYTYMDPAYGRFRHFNASWLDEAIRNNSGYLIHYNQNIQSGPQIPSPNQTEPIETGNCAGIIRQFAIENRLSDYCNIRSKRNDLNNNYCSNDLTPYYDNNNDYFRVQGETGHDLIELKISLKTAVAFEIFFQQNNSQKVKKYLKKLIKNIRQEDNTWSGGSILNSDIEYMRNIICDGYLKFHDKLLELIEGENVKIKNNSIFIRTWRTYNWKDLNEQEQNNTFYISKNSKGNN